MTDTPPVLFANDTDFVLRVKDTTLQPDYQVGRHAAPITLNSQVTTKSGLRRANDQAHGTRN